MGYLQEAAKHLPANGGYLGEDSHRAVLSSWWPQLIDDQIKLDDFGVTEFLLRGIARDRWTAGLFYGRGELYRARAKAEDFPKAAAYYRQAIAADPSFAASWRGLGLALLRGGDKSGGRKALRQYLEKSPSAPDRAMIAAMASGL